MLDAKRALEAAAEMDRINAGVAAAQLWGPVPSPAKLQELLGQFDDATRTLLASQNIPPDRKAGYRASLDQIRAALADWRSREPEGKREALASFLRPEARHDDAS